MCVHVSQIMTWGQPIFGTKNKYFAGLSTDCARNLQITSFLTAMAQLKVGQKLAGNRRLQEAGLFAGQQHSTQSKAVPTHGMDIVLAMSLRSSHSPHRPRPGLAAQPMRFKLSSPKPDALVNPDNCLKPLETCSTRKVLTPLSA